MYRRAVVFPGQGTVGGEVSGEVRRVVEKVMDGGEIPYQLSVFASSVDLFCRLRDSGVAPGVVAGHSLGEYAALYAAGCLGLEDSVRLVRARDRLMNEASAKNPGGMVALIGADIEAVEAAIEESPRSSGVVVAANFNTPRQIVLSGEEDALEEVSGKLKGKKVPLQVVGAFHSPLMEEASREMAVLLDEAEFSEPKVPIISGVDGALLEESIAVREALKGQMLSPVRWTSVVEEFASLGVEEIIECGESGTLIRMLRDFKGYKFDGKRAAEVLA